MCIWDGMSLKVLFRLLSELGGVYRDQTKSIYHICCYLEPSRFSVSQSHSANRMYRMPESKKWLRSMVLTDFDIFSQASTA